jgi:hypothetical protein
MDVDDGGFIIFSASGTEIVIEPWWREVDDTDPEFVARARSMDVRWEEFADWQHAYADMSEDAMRRGEIPLFHAIHTMSWASMEAWREEDLAFWNWYVRLRNRRASGTGRLRLERWRGRLYVIDPLTGWWIEETHPDGDADIV